MSTLYLIRHGQASFGAPDYDVLTPLGEGQARRLGEWLASPVGPPRLDAVYVGPRRRQADTARLLLESLRTRGGAAPEPVPVEGLDEYPAEVILRQSLPRLMERSPEVRELFGGDPTAPPTDARKFQRVFAHVMGRWVDGTLDAGSAETFAAFRARVEETLRDVMAREGRGRRVAVVTSAGPVSIGLQMALELSDPMALKMSWVVANSSVTELRWRGDELTLVAFNDVAHLVASGDRRLVTYL